MLPHPFEGDIVRFNDFKWTEEVSLQARDINQWGVQQLVIWNNNRATVVKEIAHIHFTALTNICLIHNKIESIEGLTRVQMAHIKCLSFAENNIISVAVIRKAAWPALQTLLMDDNYFGDARKLVEGYFAQMQRLMLYLPQQEDNNRFTEQTFSAKMQAASLHYLVVRKNKFRVNHSLERVLQQRWPQAEIR